MTHLASLDCTRRNNARTEFIRLPLARRPVSFRTPMTFHIRRVCADDGSALLAVRAATRENAFDLEALNATGINSRSLSAGIRAGKLAGCLSEVAATGAVVGFCLANVPEAELWVLAVLPDFEGRGIGRELLSRTEALLGAAGHATAWLWTSPDRSLRAYKIYKAAGWQEAAEPGERLYLRKAGPRGAEASSLKG